MRLKELCLVSCLVLAAAAKHGESEGPPATSTSESGSPGPSSTSTTMTPAQSTSSPTPTSSSASSTNQAPSNSSPSQSSLTSSSPSGQPTSSSIPIQFNPVADFTTCESATFSWLSFSNTPVTLTITVTNDRSTQNNIVIRQTQSLVTQVVSSNASSTAGSIFWPAVDVPAGRYAVLAFQTGDENAGMVESNLFNVASGSDTACLSAATSTTSLPVASSTSNATPSDSSDSSTGSEPAGSAGGSSKSLSTGALIGVVVGVVLGVLGLIIASTVMYRKDVFRVRRPRRPGAPYYLF